VNIKSFFSPKKFALAPYFVLISTVLCSVSFILIILAITSKLDFISIPQTYLTALTLIFNALIVTICLQYFNPQQADKLKIAWIGVGFAWVLGMYFLRLSSTQFTLLGNGSLNSSFSILVFSTIYIMSVWFAFTQNKNPLWLSAMGVFTVLLSTYSIFDSVSELQSFNNSTFLNPIFQIFLTNINPFVFSIISAVLIGYISYEVVSLKNVERFLLFVFVIYQVIISIFLLSRSSFDSITYWLQSLLAFIAWDFILRFWEEQSHKDEELGVLVVKHNKELINRGLFYRGGLFLLVLFFYPILGIFIKK
jgi:hypothetical protein